MNTFFVMAEKREIHSWSVKNLTFKPAPSSHHQTSTVMMYSLPNNFIVRNAHTQGVLPHTDHGFDALLVEEHTVILDRNGEQHQPSTPVNGPRYVMIHNYRVYSEEFIFLSVQVDDHLKKIKIIHTLVYVCDEDENDIMIYEQFLDLSSRLIYDVFTVLIALFHMDYLIDMSHDAGMDAETIGKLNIPKLDTTSSQSMVHAHYINCNSYIRNAHHNMLYGNSTDNDNSRADLCPNGNYIHAAAAIMASLQEVGR
jgi:hypothetical protein